MSDLLSIGASGLRAYQVALGTVSENIANTGVEGYSRRVTRMRELGGATSASITSNAPLGGSGVLVDGIGRMSDQFRQTSVRDSSSNLARTETSVTWLERIEQGLSDNDLGDRLTAFFTAARTLASDPTSVPQRATFLEAAGAVAASFSATGRSLDRAAGDLAIGANQAVATLNNLAEGLARVNEGLTRTGAGSTTAAQLADQRDQILEQMSAITDVAVSIDALGRASVQLGGRTGPTLIEGTYAGRLTMAAGEGGTIALSVERSGERASVSPVGGTLAGFADGAQRIAAARTSLDAIARDFVGQVNAVQQGGDDLDGNPGAPLFTAGDPPTEIKVALDDPRGIAAASRGGGPRDTGNLAALQSVRTARGFETALTGLITGNGSALQQQKLVADAQGSIREGAITARDGVSGVDLDTEAIDLMRFQQAYQASARVISVAKETMQYLLDLR